MSLDAEWLQDLFAGFGPVRLKRMFSGYGVYDGDFCIALAFGGRAFSSRKPASTLLENTAANPGLCLRVDDENRAEMVALGASPFTYAKQGKTITVGKWWKLPEALMDEPDEISRLARLSLGVARRLPPKKPRAKKSRTTPEKTQKKPG